jgi:hypothetical protein
MSSAAAVIIITPKSLSAALKSLRSLLLSKAICEEAVQILSDLELTEYDKMYFNELEIEEIKHQLFLASIFACLNMNHEVVNAIEIILEVYIYPVFIKNMWMGNRLLKDDTSKDIGILADLPDLIKYEIQKKVFGDNQGVPVGFA